MADADNSDDKSEGNMVTFEDVELLKQWVIAQSPAVSADLVPYLAAYVNAAPHLRAAALADYQAAAVLRITRLSAEVEMRLNALSIKASELNGRRK